MLKKILSSLFVVAAFVLGMESCGSKPYACIEIEDNGDSVHVNQPISINGYCSSHADQYNWQINLDSVYFTPRITLRFATPGEQEIYLFVSNQGKSTSTIKKLTIYP